MATVPALTPTEDDISKMLVAQVHVGTRNLDPSMERYIWKRRNDGKANIFGFSFLFLWFLHSFFFLRVSLCQQFYFNLHYVCFFCFALFSRQM